MRSLPSGVSWWWVVAGLVFFPGIAAGVTTYTLQRETDQSAQAIATVTPTPSPEPEAGDPAVRVIRTAGLLDGLALSLEEYERRKDLPPIGLMVDNHPNANPQYGLDRADIVYEVLADGGVTRLLALYWRQDAERVEPVASSSSALVALAQGHHAVIGHSGGDSPDGSEAVIAVDAFHPANATAFRRSLDHQFPHNLTTSTELIRTSATSQSSLPAPVEPGWQFRSEGEAPGALPEIDVIQVDFGGPDHTSAQWHWDSRAEMYARFQSGKPHLDAQTQQQLRFRNVVVLASPGRTEGFAGDEAVSAQGQAWIFVDGGMIEGTWRKAAADQPLQLLRADGTVASLNRGSTWVAMFGPDGAVIAVPHEETPPTVAVARPTQFIPRDDPPTQLPPPPPTSTPRPTTSATVSTTASPSTSPSPGPSVTTPTPPSSVTPTTPPPTSTVVTTPTLIPVPTATLTPPPQTQTAQ